MSVNIYKSSSWKDIRNATSGYTKAEANDKFISAFLPDAEWTQIPVWASVVTAGEIWFCCRNGVVFIEGTGLSWKAGDGSTIKALTFDIPTMYKSYVESIGLVFTDNGKTPFGYCYSRNNTSGVMFVPSTTALTDGSGVFFITYSLLRM